MHQHVAHPPNPEQNGLMDNISDTLLNAFSKVRKPDERFLAMRESVDKFEERLNVSERLWNRVRSRTNGEWDLSRPTFLFMILRPDEMMEPTSVKILPGTITTWRWPCRV